MIGEKKLKNRRGDTSLGRIFMIAVVVMVVVIGSLYAFLEFYGPIELVTVAQTPSGEVKPVETGMLYFYEHGGTLSISIYSYNQYNDSKVTGAHPQWYVYHSKDIDFSSPSGKVFGTMSASENSTSGDLWVSDNGVLYLVGEMATENGWFMGDNGDLEYSASGPTPWDYDDDGVMEYMWKLDLTDIPKLAAGESSKSIILNAYLKQADESFAIKSDYNATGVSNSEWKYLEAAIYVGLDEGHAVKVNKIELDLTGTGSNYNHTMVDNNSVQIQYFELYGEGDRSYRFGPEGLDLGAKKVEFDLSSYVDDEVQEINGITFFRDDNEPARFMTGYLRIKCKFDTLDGWIPNVKITFIDPAGTMSTKSQLVKFSAS